MTATDWITAGGTLVMAIATIALAVMAALAWRTAKSTLEQMRSDSAAQTRPYVSARLAPGFWGEGSWDLIVDNAGRSIARKLTIELDEWPEQEAGNTEQHDRFIKELRGVFAAERSLPPGTSLRLIWRHKNDSSENPFGLASEATISLQYYGTDDTAKYIETAHLSTDIAAVTPMPTRGADPNRTMKEHPIANQFYSMLRLIAANIRLLDR